MALPAPFGWWRQFGARFVTTLCTTAATMDSAGNAMTRNDGMAGGFPADLLESAPPMVGAEYLGPAVLEQLWREIAVAWKQELAETGLDPATFLQQLHPAWHLMGRVHLHLAENRGDEDAPFAFLSTYTDRLSDHGKVQHKPLGRALAEYADQGDHTRLLSLLEPVRRAAESCHWLGQLVESGEIYHPLRWSVEEAYHMLQDVPLLEAAGVVVRMPAVWALGRPSRPTVSVTVGQKQPSVVGAGALLDFRMDLTLDGQPLTAEEEQGILQATAGLAFIRGRWVELDPARLARTLERFRVIEGQADQDRFTLFQGLRLLAGTGSLASEDGVGAGDPDMVRVQAGRWLESHLEKLHTPGGSRGVKPGRSFKAVLRPYQQIGLEWLHLLDKLGLGACLADDMGLGKTLQVLGLLSVHKQSRSGGRGPALLVVPTTLIANWCAEIDRFMPALKVLVAHPSVTPRSELLDPGPDDIDDRDLVITSYGSVSRFAWITERPWRLLVLDEAQAIKNPGTAQSRAVKGISATSRIALTGTPIENSLGDLWSLFDFLNPGLLGARGEFSRYARNLTERPGGYASLRRLVSPYILRRMKTDPRVIADLPGKTELKTWCSLSRAQAALYQQAVKDLSHKLQTTTGIQRRGLVLSTLMRLKQICNHPSQWLGDNAWASRDSGKWARLAEVCEVIHARQEKVLLFTQFRELTEPLAAYLGSLFGRTGLVLHGGTPVRERRRLVEDFQQDETIPFFVLSLKAGGSGLNLTAASHVIHVDRWWNPAVEDQATDRAFRIGQKRAVMVHKFICRGTLEERIDALIESKQGLSRELLQGSAELNLTELSNEELLRVVSLDLAGALKEA
jgi:superfamily II DNA or RNA helicase